MAAKFKPQFRRLQFIDRKLREGERSGVLPNCSTLAAEWEVSAKTIQRDLAFLRDELHAPIEYDEIGHGYRYTEKEFVLPAVRIAQGELFAICLAEKVLRQYENTPVYHRLREVFDKLESLLPDNVSMHPSALDERVTFFPEAAPRIAPEVWERALEALRRGRTLDIRYHIPGKPAPYDTRVDPYHVIGHRGEWYVLGRCHYKNAIRLFGFSRIQKAAVSDDPFRIPDGFDFQKQWRNHFGVMAPAGEWKVRLRFCREQAPYATERDWHPTQAFRPRRDGSVDMTFVANHLFEVKRWVLSWGAGVTVLGPAELRDMVRNEAAALVKTYQGAR